MLLVIVVVPSLGRLEVGVVLVFSLLGGGRALILFVFVSVVGLSLPSPTGEFPSFVPTGTPLVVVSPNHRPKCRRP